MKVDAEKLGKEAAAGGGRGVGADVVKPAGGVIRAVGVRAGAGGAEFAPRSALKYSSSNEKKASVSLGSASTAAQGVVAIRRPKVVV